MAEEFYRMPDPDNGTRQELVRGVIVSYPLSGFYHGVCCARLAGLLGEAIEERDLGCLTCNNVGIILARNPDSVRTPDLAFWRKERQPDPRLQGYPEVVPDLAVEVLDPADYPSDLATRLREYLEGGFRLVWVVHPTEKGVASYRPGQTPTVLAVNDTLSGEDVVPGFSCPVAQLFP